MQDPHQLVPRMAQMEIEVRHLGGIIKGEDGKTMGIGPMVLQHEEDINGEDGLKKNVRKLQDQSIKTAAYVGGAVATAVTIVEILFRLWDSLPK